MTLQIVFSGERDEKYQDRQRRDRAIRFAEDGDEVRYRNHQRERGKARKELFDTNMTNHRGKRRNDASYRNTCGAINSDPATAAANDRQ